MPQVSTTTSSSVKKPGRTLTRTSSLKRVVTTLTKTPRFKSLRRMKSSPKKCPQVSFSAQFKVQQPTCSSTLKDSQFPVYLLLAPGGTESEGTSVPNVCPYTYCSLNGHHCAPPPPLRCFVAGRRRSLKTRRGAKSVEKPAFQEEDFGIEIYAAGMEEEQGTGLPHSDMENTNMGKEECVPVGDRQMKVVCGCDTGTEAIDMDSEKGRFSLQFDNHEADDEKNNKNGYSSEFTSDSGLQSFKCIQVEIFGHGERYEEEEDETDKNIDDFIGTMVTSTEAFVAPTETLAMKPQLSCRANSFLDLPDEALKMEVDQHENQALTNSVCCDDEANLESGRSFYIFNSGEEPIFVSDNDTVCQNRNIDEYIGTMVRSTEVSEAKIETHSIKLLLSNDANSLLDLPDDVLTEADEALMEADQYEKQTHVDEALLVEADQHESQIPVEEAPIEADETLMKADQHENQILEDEALMEFDQLENQTLIDEVWETNVENLPIKSLLNDGLTDGAPIDDSCHENETLHADCSLLGKQSSSDHNKINEDENQEEVLEESMRPYTEEMDRICKDAASSSMKTAIFKAGGDSNQELADTCNKLKLRKGCPRADINEEEPRKFNPRQPNFLLAEADLEAEKVDLRHQVMDERKHSEDWMLDYALQQTVNKLSPARNRKVALLVEAFETVLPIPDSETNQRLPPPTAFPHSRHIQACN